MTWQSFRPASAAPGSKPTVYFTTLPADADAAGTTRYNLATVGAQTIRRAVELTLVAGSAELTLPGQRPQPLAVGRPVTLPAKGSDAGAELTFTGETCSLKVVPSAATTSVLSAEKTLEGEVTTMSTTTEDDGGDNGGPPPPPLPPDEPI